MLDVAWPSTIWELTTFTPYSNTYAGYAIDGAASMKLNYQNLGNRLEGDNDITIKKLRNSGRRSEPCRPGSALGLAIALLSDSSGVIKMNLKVRAIWISLISQPGQHLLGRARQYPRQGHHLPPSPACVLDGGKDLMRSPSFRLAIRPDPDPADQAGHPSRRPSREAQAPHERSRQGQLQRRAPHPPAPEAERLLAKPPAARWI